MHFFRASRLLYAHARQIVKETFACPTDDERVRRFEEYFGSNVTTLRFGLGQVRREGQFAFGAVAAPGGGWL